MAFRVRDQAGGGEGSHLDSGGARPPDLCGAGPADTRGIPHRPVAASHRRNGTTDQAALYRTVISAYVLPHIGAVPLQSLTGADVQSLYGTLSARGGRTGGALSPNTVQSAHRALRKALGDAVAWGLLVRNPATGVKPPQQRRPKPKTWTADELSQFLDHVRGDRL